jgi:hypothetical protein
LRKSPMALVTYYVVIVFDPADDGGLRPREQRAV